MIRLIMSDMDGTLLDDDGRIPEGFDEVAAMLKEHNILFVPASGRQYYTLAQQFEKSHGFAPVTKMHLALKARAGPRYAAVGCPPP